MNRRNCGVANLERKESCGECGAPMEERTRYGLVSYGSMPSAVRNFFEMLPCVRDHTEGRRKKGA